MAGKRQPNKQPLHVTNDPNHPDFYFHPRTLEEGRNDPAPVQAALSRLNVNDPPTFGGMSSSSTSAQPESSSTGTRLASFTLHTPPDVTRDTHIIAVLGIEQKWASPRDDGWFLSDFLAFWHLLSGLTNSQTWLHCLNLDKLISEHKRYLHGSPFKERKEVLNAEMLPKIKTAGNAPRYIAGMGIKKAFTDAIMSECKIANEKKHNVLILMFGHGQEKDQGIDIGVATQKTLKLKTFSKNLEGFSDARITILSTACFSGGWSCIPDLRALSSTMMAAGKQQVSRSWNYSFSYGRASGSMFASAVIEKLISLSPGETLLDAAEEEDRTEETQIAQEETYDEFCSSIYETLLRDLDRRGLEHGITFSAQNDNWSGYFSQRVGIPLTEFKARWDALPVYHADARMHPGHWSNRDPNVSVEAAQEYRDIRSRATVTSSETMEATGPILGKRKTSGLYGGEPAALIRQVSRAGEEYLRAYDYFDDSGNDGALHNLIRRIIDGQEEDEDEVERAWNTIRYRLHQMATADQYLEAMGVPPPLGKQCCDYNTLKVSQEVGGEKYSEITRWIFDTNILFPSATEEQGRPFYKGVHYLTAAFHYANLSKQQIQAKLKDLERMVNTEVERHENLVKRDPEVTSKRQKLFNIYGKVLRNVSPHKRAERRSRGLSLTGPA